MLSQIFTFDKVQIIFKAITSRASWWVLRSMETLLDTGLAALESISPGIGKLTYYGTLRYRTLPTRQSFSRQ